jgi:putative flippase GtrA
MAVHEPTPTEPLTSGPLMRVIRDQRTAFLLVGAFNTGFGLLVFILMQLSLGKVVGYMGALLATHVISVLVAFTLHRHLVFKVRGQVWTDLARFEIVNLGSLALNAVLLPLLVEVGGLPVIPAQCIAGVAVVIISWVGHHSFSFRRSPAQH